MMSVFAPPDSAALPPVLAGARQGRLRQYQLQLLQRMQAARSSAQAGRKELGVLLGGRHCLLDLTQLGEIVIPAGLAIQAVPLAQDWYLGLAAMRGRLTAVVDLALFFGEAPCVADADSRIISLAPRLGVNSALLVGRVLGLRQQRGMLALAHATDTPQWAAQVLCDKDQQQWLRLDLAQLAQSERFLDAGFAAAPVMQERR
ncbi:chemotaxis protein CheW [Janthinobacterium aquaticum]|uniref:chemotaxis protein CheW n=1 Tax=Janthinobacterium sp. FT58W TaxID=2654254 RepID=UPI001D014B20|nr:chemotaxis protein CheW [Janthinobacterium sp. FT58W]